MNKHRLIIAIFTIGLLVLIAAFSIGWLNIGNMTVSEQEFAIWTLLSILAVATIVLAITGIIDTGKERWLAFILVAGLILGFSVFLLDIGLVLFAPFGLVLLIYSLFKLRRYSLN